MGVVLKPVHVTCGGSYPNPQKWKTYLDHVDILACPPTMPKGSVPVFTIKKDTRYMTPEAHFYGLYATCILINKNGAPRMVEDFQVAQHDVRKLMVVLCRSDGGTLPEPSHEHYPAEKVICPVSFTVFRDCPIDTEVCMIPDPDRVDVKTTPRDEWVYAPTLAGTNPGVYEVRLRVQSKIRNYQTKNRLVKYAFGGVALRQKIIRHPLDRDAGSHVPNGPIPGHIARPGIGASVMVTTTKKVLVNEDFLISGVPIRVKELTEHGFKGHKILV